MCVCLFVSSRVCICVCSCVSARTINSRERERERERESKLKKRRSKHQKRESVIILFSVTYSSQTQTEGDVFMVSFAEPRVALDWMTAVQLVSLEMERESVWRMKEGESMFGDEEEGCV